MPRRRLRPRPRVRRPYPLPPTHDPRPTTHGNGDCDCDCDSSRADEIAHAVDARGSQNVAAILIELVNGIAGGAYVLLDGYLRRVAEICRERDVLVIHDEVLTGLWRPGLPLDSRHWEGCEPDIVVLSKGLEAGYTPVAPSSSPRRSPRTSATQTPTHSRRWTPWPRTP
ncbi:aminotransferase class III-fold pyridoxal phosphate-dependent enzyme [Streptomyces sp. NPDC127049]|uniref:aminotransferase class III-fold pyridoxal phosphate-dependent enzyme n=1 Tax=Streptomyces sp. NPDC127049 TaxID=3347118 RepID=UPI00365F9E00